MLHSQLSTPLGARGGTASLSLLRRADGSNKLLLSASRSGDSTSDVSGRRRDASASFSHELCVDTSEGVSLECVLHVATWRLGLSYAHARLCVALGTGWAIERDAMSAVSMT